MILRLVRRAALPLAAAMVSFLLIALHAGLMLGVVVRVLLRRPARGVVLAWLFLAVTLPYVGAAAYFLIGERRIPRSRARRLGRRTSARRGHRGLARPRGRSSRGRRRRDLRSQKKKRAIGPGRAASKT